MSDGYVEDEWRALTNLTLNFGLRSEYQAKVFNQGVDINDKEIYRPPARLRSCRT